jgi:predicted transcriptional regulator
MIVTHPGLELRSLAELCGLNEHTLKYHLDQ